MKSFQDFDNKWKNYKVAKRSSRIKKGVVFFDDLSKIGSNLYIKEN